MNERGNRHGPAVVSVCKGWHIQLVGYATTHILSLSHFILALGRARWAVCHLICEYQYIVISHIYFSETRWVWGKIHICTSLIDQGHLVIRGWGRRWQKDDHLIIKKAYEYEHIKSQNTLVKWKGQNRSSWRLSCVPSEEHWRRAISLAPFSPS